MLVAYAFITPDEIVPSSDVKVPKDISCVRDVLRQQDSQGIQDGGQGARAGRQASGENEADCIFAFGVSDSDSISQIVEKIDCQINIRAGQGVPTVSELEKLGVARASIATGAICATLGLLKRIAN